MRNAIISIKSIQTSGEETDTTEIITEGQYVIVSFDGSLLIRYNETEATGYDGSTTTVNVIDGKWLKMIRTGSSEAELLVELDKKNYCHYNTPFGSLTMGVSAEKVEASYSDEGAHVLAEYIIDVNSLLVGKYSLKIDVRPV